MKSYFLYWALVIMGYIYGVDEAPSSKETTLYLGHAEYEGDGKSTCVVWPILATSNKQADSLFKVVIDAEVKAAGADMNKGNYGVWKVKNYLKIKHDTTNRGY